MDKTLNL